RWILGGDGADFTGKVSGMPGAVQQMPSGLYPPPAWNQSLAPPATIYDLYDSPPAPPGLDSSGLSNAVEAELAARLVEFKQFHTLRLSATDRHPNTWAIFGTGLPTDTGIGFGLVEGPVPIQQPEGDGTVPVPSGS